MNLEMLFPNRKFLRFASSTIFVTILENNTTATHQRLKMDAKLQCCHINIEIYYFAFNFLTVFFSFILVNISYPRHPHNLSVAKYRHFIRANTTNVYT